jgi:hypothetical protein
MLRDNEFEEMQEDLVVANFNHIWFFGGHVTIFLIYVLLRVRCQLYWDSESQIEKHENKYHGMFKDTRLPFACMH